MKKSTIALCLALSMIVLAFSSCVTTSDNSSSAIAETESVVCEHEWKNATCTEPKTCTKCGATEGSALGHKFTPATCTKHKRCVRCGKTDGAPLGHNYDGKYCTRCGKKNPNYEETIIANAISLNVPDTLTMKTGETKVISYSLSPKPTKKPNISWSSSNNSVASINPDGKITAKGKGTCNITINAGPLSKTITLNVKFVPDFRKLYDKYCDSEWAQLASDNTYLSIDTNPNNWDDFWVDEAAEAIRNIHKELNIPDSVLEKMYHTSFNDGRVTEVIDEISISWKYHPDLGLEVIYSIKQ